MMMSKFDLEFIKKELPGLIRTSDEIKGAIITALSSVIPTRQQMDDRFFDLKKDMDERFFDLKKNMDERFEKIDQRFFDLQKNMNERFEKIDQRFEKVDQRFEKVDQRFLELKDELNKRFEQQDLLLKMIKLDITRMESKEGHAVETLIREILKTTLKLENIDPDKIDSITLLDKDGIVFYPGYNSDIDILIQNGDTILIELKASTGSQDIAHFLQNAKLYELLYQKIPTQLILASIRIKSETIRLAESKGIKVIWGEISAY